MRPENFHFYDNVEAQKYDNFIFVNTLNNADNKSEYEIFNQLLPIKKIAETFQVKEKLIFQVIKKLIGSRLNYDSLLDYYFIPIKFPNNDNNNSNYILVKEKVGYTELYDKEKCRYYTQDYNVYLKCNDYNLSALSEIVKEIIKCKFPQLFDYKANPFLFIEDYKFSLEERIFLSNIKRNMMIDLLHKPIIKNITFDDISKTLTRKSYIETKIQKSLITCYYDSTEIYITLFEEEITVKDTSWKYERCLYVPIQTLITKDWSLVENQYVHGQAYIDDSGKRVFLKGKQCDMPYFKNEKVELIKNLITR